MVWWAIINSHLFGPYFFNGEVTGEVIRNFSIEYLHPLLEDVDLETRQRMWLQLDGAPVHYEDKNNFACSISW